MLLCVAYGFFFVRKVEKKRIIYKSIKIYNYSQKMTEKHFKTSGAVYLLVLLAIITFVSLTGASGTKNDDIFCNKQSYSVTVKRKGCKTEKFVVSACLGNCPSYQKPLQDSPYFQSKCYSCRASRVVNKEFLLSECVQQVDRLVTIESAEACACKQSDACK